MLDDPPEVYTMRVEVNKDGEIIFISANNLLLEKLHEYLRRKKEISKEVNRAG